MIGGLFSLPWWLLPAMTILSFIPMNVLFIWLLKILIKRIFHAKTNDLIIYIVATFIVAAICSLLYLGPDSFYIGGTSLYFYVSAFVALFILKFLEKIKITPKLKFLLVLYSVIFILPFTGLFLALTLPQIYYEYQHQREGNNIVKQAKENIQFIQFQSPFMRVIPNSNNYDVKLFLHFPFTVTKEVLSSTLAVVSVEPSKSNIIYSTTKSVCNLPHPSMYMGNIISEVEYNSITYSDRPQIPYIKTFFPDKTYFLITEFSNSNKDCSAEDYATFDANQFKIVVKK